MFKVVMTNVFSANYLIIDKTIACKLPMQYTVLTKDLKIYMNYF